MSELRDALATALDVGAALWPDLLADGEATYLAAHALADPGFREALRASIAQALAGGPEGIALTESIYKPGTSALDLHDEWWTTPNDLAAEIVEGIVEGMLG